MARGRFNEDRITEADVLDVVSRQKALNFVPGTEYLYSNTGYTLAGTIVKRVSGKSLRDYADERIFQPLGMTQTHFHDDYTMVVPGRTSAYVRFADGKLHVSIPNYDTYGATSLFTTVGDLLKWEMNFERPTVGDATLLADMQTSAVLANGDTTGYGLGISTEIYRGARLVGHSGGDAGYRSYVGRFPQHELAVAIACNGAVNTGAIARSVADVFIGKQLSAPAETTVTSQAKLSAEQMAAKAGIYVNPATGAPTWITVRDSNLALGRTTGPALIPLSESRFRATGAQVELEFKANGALTQTSLSWPPRQPVTLTRWTGERLKPTRDELARYVGTYYSEELDATYIVTATDSTLLLRTRTSEPRTVRPAYGDVFVGANQVQFTRDSKRSINGMLMSSGRVRRVGFKRI
jgi:hypothetical protein